MQQFNVKDKIYYTLGGDHPPFFGKSSVVLLGNEHSNVVFPKEYKIIAKEKSFVNFLKSLRKSKGGGLDKFLKENPRTRILVAEEEMAEVMMYFTNQLQEVFGISDGDALLILQKQRERYFMDYRSLLRISSGVYKEFKKSKDYELRKEDTVYDKKDTDCLPLEISYLLYARNINNGDAIKSKLEKLRPYFYDRIMSVLSHHTIRSLMSYPRAIEEFLGSKIGEHDLLGAIEGNAFLNEVYLCRDDHEKSMEFYKKHEKNISKLVKCVLAVDELDGESDILEKEIGRLNEHFKEGCDFKCLLDHNHEAFFSEYMFTDDNRKVNVHLIRTLADERRQMDKKK